MESTQAEDKLFTFLEALGIKTETHRHPPVFTVDEAQAIRTSMGKAMTGGHAKSLFLRDKKKRRALVVIDENRRLDLRSLAGKVGLSRVSFGSKNSLLEMLGVTPGSVTPFALVNALSQKGAEPTLIIALDKALLAQTPLWFHPLHNGATTAIKPNDLILFIKACGYTPLLIDLDPPNMPENP